MSVRTSFVLALMAICVWSLPVHRADAMAGKPSTRELVEAPAYTNDLQSALTLDGLYQHLRALQEVADKNAGTRASGTRGFVESADYVKARLGAAGYKVATQQFEFGFFAELKLPVFERISPGHIGYRPGIDFTTYQYSGSGDITGKLQVVGASELQLTDGLSDNYISPLSPKKLYSGCVARDFAAFPRAAVAVVNDSGCLFKLKVDNAQAAGASAVIILGGGASGVTEAIAGTLGRPAAIPVIGTSFDLGQELLNMLAARGECTVHVAVSAVNEQRMTENIIAESGSGDEAETVIIGSHLDSVPEGPGINDNGAGVAANLELATQLAKLKIDTRRRLRFAFWGGEEFDLAGSQTYVERLGSRGVAKTYAYIDLDSIASPNPVPFIWEPDLRNRREAPRSTDITDLFASFYSAQGWASKSIPFNERGDFESFLAVGIASGGLFTGGELLKTPAEAKQFGGVAGVPYDSCYHRACDTITNISPTALHQSSQALAHAVLTLGEPKIRSRKHGRAS